MIIVNIGNKVMQDQLTDEIKLAGFHSIDEYLEKQRKAFCELQQSRHPYRFYEAQFKNMYPGGFDEKIKPTNSVESFDYTHCKRLLNYKPSSYSTNSVQLNLDISKQNIIDELCHLRNDFFGHETRIECDNSALKRLNDYNNVQYNSFSCLAKFENNVYKLRPNDRDTIEKEIERYLNDKIENLIENTEFESHKAGCCQLNSMAGENCTLKCNFQIEDLQIFSQTVLKNDTKGYMNSVKNIFEESSKRFMETEKALVYETVNRAVAFEKVSWTQLRTGNCKKANKFLEKQKKLLKVALEKSKNINLEVNDALIFKINLYLVSCYLNLMRVQKAKKILKKIFKTCPDDKKLKSSALFLFGKLNLMKGKNDVALSYLEASLKLHEEVKEDDSDTVALLNYIANVWSKLGEEKKAVDHKIKALAYYEELYKDESNLEKSACLHGIIKSYDILSSREGNNKKREEYKNLANEKRQNLVQL